MSATRVLTHAEAPWLSAPESRAVIAAIAAGGQPARFVGGCVRDALLRRPVTDVDIATPELPQKMMELLAVAGIKAIPTGLDHGTVTAVAGGRTFEITTLRRDVETDGRRAVVAFTADWTEDAARRDFTINALSADPDGTVHDPFGGIADLAAGHVRFVGDPETRIREDVLRILRFFRFHAHYGRGTPDAAALAACRKTASLLPTLSGERVAAELRRLLEAPDAAGIVREMRDDGVLAPILPELDNIERLQRLQALPEPAVLDAILRLAALLPREAAVADAVAERLRLSNAERERLRILAQPPALWAATDARALKRALYHLGPEIVRDLGLLAWADGDVAPGRAAVAAARSWSPLALPVRGQDVLDRGVPPGPEVGRLVGQVETWWEDQDYHPDRAACLRHLEALIRSKT